MQRRDCDIADGFNDMSRSNAVLRICVLRRLALFREDEFSLFSEELRSEIRRFLEYRNK